MQKPEHSVKDPIDYNSAFAPYSLQGSGISARSPVACKRDKGATPQRQWPRRNTNPDPARELCFDMSNGDGLEALSKRELLTLLRRQPCGFDDSDLAVLADSIMSRLKALRARAREGKCVDEASEFARWVRSSGLLKLCHSTSARGELEKLVGDTLWDCELFWRNQGQGPWVAKSELEAVNAKLDNLASLVSNLVQRGNSPPNTELAVVNS